MKTWTPSVLPAVATITDQAETITRMIENLCGPLKHLKHHPLGGDRQRHPAASQPATADQPWHIAAWHITAPSDGCAPCTPRRGARWLLKCSATATPATAPSWAENTIDRQAPLHTAPELSLLLAHGWTPVCLACGVAATAGGSGASPAAGVVAAAGGA